MRSHRASDVMSEVSSPTHIAGKRKMALDKLESQTKYFIVTLNQLTFLRRGIQPYFYLVTFGICFFLFSAFNAYEAEALSAQLDKQWLTLTMGLFTLFLVIIWTLYFVQVPIS